MALTRRLRGGGACGGRAASWELGLPKDLVAGVQRCVDPGACDPGSKVRAACRGAVDACLQSSGHWPFLVQGCLPAHGVGP